MPRKSILSTFVPDEPLLTPKKRINTNTKGRRNEKKTDALLTKLGFAVHTTQRGGHRGLQNDIFNAFDHVALRDQHCYWIQTKSNSTGNAAKKIKEAIPDHARTHMLIFVFVWLDRQKVPKVYNMGFFDNKLTTLLPTAITRHFGEDFYRVCDEI